jgi:hypothetical protein
MTAFSQSCGVGYSYGLAATLRIISGKWKPLILYFLLDGPKHYGELKRTIQGVSDKVLIRQLKELEADRGETDAPEPSLRSAPVRSVERALFPIFLLQRTSAFRRGTKDLLARNLPQHVVIVPGPLGLVWRFHLH